MTAPSPGALVKSCKPVTVLCEMHYVRTVTLVKLWPEIVPHLTLAVLILTPVRLKRPRCVW